MSLFFFFLCVFSLSPFLFKSKRYPTPSIVSLLLPPSKWLARPQEVPSSKNLTETTENRYKKKREPMEEREKHSPPSRLLLQQVEKHNRTHKPFVCLWLSRCGLFLWLQTDGLWFSFQKKRKKEKPNVKTLPFHRHCVRWMQHLSTIGCFSSSKEEKKGKKDVSDNTRKEFSKSREKQKNCNRVKTNATSCIVNVSVHFQMIRFTPPSVQEQHLSQVLQWNEERPSLFVQNNKYWNGKWKNGMHTNYNCPTAHIHNALNYHLICYFLLVRSKNINFLHQNRIKINSIRAVFSK